MPQINPYFRPAEAQFINTFVPIPFEQMIQAGQMKQQRYDQALTATDATINAIDDIVAIPNSADEIRAREYSQKMREIRDKYVGRDISDPFIQRELSNEIHRSIPKDDIRHIQESYQGYLGYNKMLNALSAEGVNPPNELLQDFTGYDSTVDGVFTGSPNRYVDPLVESKEFFNDLDYEDQGSFYEKIKGQETGRIGVREAVTADRIKEYAKNNLKSYMTRPGIKMYIDTMKKRGDTRSREEIAMAYVNSISPEFVKSRTKDYAFDPEYLNRARNTGKNPTNPGDDYELIVTDATGKDIVKKREREINKYIEQQYKLATEEGDPNALNVYNQMLEAKNIGFTDPKYTTKINTLKVEDTKKVLDKAVSALKKEGLSEKEALDFLNIDGIGDAVLTTFHSVHGKTSDLIDRYHNFSDVIGKKLTTDVSGFNTALIGTITRNKNLVDLGVKIAESGDIELKERRESRGNIDNKSQILTDYYKDLKGISKEVNKLNKEAEEVGYEAVNKLFGHQDTYTAMNTMFESKDGVIKEVFYDENNTLKYKDSPIAKNLSNMLPNITDYQSYFYDENGKLDKKSIKELQSLYNQSDSQRFMGFDNKPTEDGGLLARFRLYAKGEGDKLNQIGNEFKIKMPSNTEYDMQKISENLDERGQEKTRSMYLNYNYVNNLVTSLNLANNERDIPLSKIDPTKTNPEDKIVLKKVGYKYKPVLILDGEEIDMFPGEPISYGTDASTLTSVIIEYFRNNRL